MVQPKDAAKRYFDRKSIVYFDENYARMDNKYPVLHLRHNYILNMMDDVRGGALDIGCGSGAMLADLSARGHEVFGVDISPFMVRKARTLPLKLGLAEPIMCVADIENLPFVDKSFELVVCAGVIEYLHEDEKSLSEISRVLKPKGTAFISVTNALTPFWFFETFVKIIGFWKSLVSLTRKDTSFPKTRAHVPYYLAKKARAIGLEKSEVAYFHYSPLPAPLNSIFPQQCIRIGLRMETLSKSRLGFMGRGCIIKFVKNGQKEV